METASVSLVALLREAGGGFVVVDNTMSGAPMVAQREALWAALEGCASSTAGTTGAITKARLCAPEAKPLTGKRARRVRQLAQRQRELDASRRGRDPTLKVA